MEYQSPGDQFLKISWAMKSPCSLLFCILLAMRLLEATWVDPDTSEYDRSTTPLYHEDSRQYQLVFSDEFEQDGRSFHDGRDPRWTAIHKNDCEFLAMSSHRFEMPVLNQGRETC